jgi:hypothetical protein
MSQSLLERVHICRRCWKTKNVQELEDFSEEQQAVELFKTNKGLMNNYHKTKTIVDHSGNNTQY